MNKEVKKKGRPTDSPKIGLIKFRCDKESNTQLEYCCKELSLSKSEVLRISIDNLYNELSKKMPIKNRG